MATPSYDKRDNGAYPPPQNPPSSYPPPQNPQNSCPPPQNPAPSVYSGGAAYPYAIPPPPPSSYPTTFYQEPTPTVSYQPSVTSSFLCRFLTFITVVVIALGVILLIAYLIFKPRLPDFRVDSASLTSLSFTGSEITAGWDITLVVSNPNRKLDISYNAVSSDVFYSDNHAYGFLTSTRLAPFKQPTRSMTTIQVRFEVVDEFVDNGVANGIVVGRARGLVKFGVVLTALIRFNGLFHPRDHRLKVVCYPLSFALSSNVNNVTGVLLRGLTCD